MRTSRKELFKKLSDASPRQIEALPAIYESLIKNSNCYFAILSPEGTIAYSNPAWNRLSGVKDLNSESTSIFSLFTTKDAIILQQVIQHINDWSSIRQLTVQLNDKYKSAFLNVNLVYDEDAQSILFYAQDCTAQELQQRNQREKTAELNARLENIESKRLILERRIMAANLEIKRLEQLCKEQSAIIQEQENSFQDLARLNRTAYPELIRRASVNCDSDEILDDLRSFNGGICEYLAIHRTPQPESIDLEALLNSTVYELSKDVSAEISINADNLPTINADPEMMSIVLKELLDNTIRFSRSAKTELSISCQAFGAEWLFTWQDSNPPIPAEQNDRIFKAGNIYHSSEAGRLTGMGLAKVKYIITRHGGKVWLDPSSTEYFCMKFTLPRKNKIRTIGELRKSA